ncbi:beta-ketoacyl-ACP synthase II [Clostridium sp. BJN0001]|uniref:beta-ketoacyl-ACP synthase II n=1 Tax=Clostridium sp. BJN0001 TaxID=2930219 RepID=UPI001FD1DD4A|nr:beta-ketoacyl-ACP synthase II [Clostridium sp. BJN0001]
MERRVVITGMGAITPIGNDVEAFWDNAKLGKSGIDFITLMDKDLCDVKIAGEVKGFDSEGYFGRKEVKRLDRFAQFALYVSDEAIKDSKIDLEKEDLYRFGVMFGSGIGGIHSIEKECAKIAVGKSKRVSPFFVPMSIINLGAGNIAIRHGLKGPCSSVVTACATGNDNIGQSYRMIKHGYADIMLAGGAEAPVCHMGVGGFSGLKALCTNNDPKRASIPFDKERSGFVIGEGAGALILESLEHAQKRGANILAEIVGYSATCDAHHITAPDPEGLGAAKAMEDAIKEASIDPSEVSYINAHGTSTHLNDLCETKAIKETFKDSAYKIPISSTKSMTGHLLGGAGAIEAIIAVKATMDDFVPPTIGYEVKDEELDLDYVPNEGRKATVNYALSNSIGFGGHNAAILLKKWK